jgi:signal transduction histidine kinase/CheY-like chemotaxis protein
MEALALQLASQPPWSDVPLLIFASQSAFDLTSARAYLRLRQTANVTIVERPVRVRTMISAVHSALRARRRQYQVRDLLRELHRRVEERDQFLAMLSHELRNPLAAISLAADNLEQSPEKTNDRAIIIRQTRHLTKLVDDLLDIGRITSGKITLHRRPVDLGDLVEHCVETMRPRAESRRLTMTMNRLAPQVFISGDPVRLEQIVANVLSNAIKYTSSGGRIDVTVGSEGTEAVLRVRDTGKGIPEEILPHVFDLFTQGEVSIDRGEGGMGIGLTLVKRLADLHGGTVRASSDGPGRGSEFVVALPLTATQPEMAAEPEAHPQSDHPRDIVVVEDNQDIRELLRFKLQHLGHEVEVAEDGQSGLDVILEKRPHVALVDIGLPGVNGYELARQVREKLGSSIYLIALTGYGQAEDKKKALDAGFDIHLTKPADFVDLQKVIGRSPIDGGRAVS